MIYLEEFSFPSFQFENDYLADAFDYYRNAFLGSYRTDYYMGMVYPFKVLGDADLFQLFFFLFRLLFRQSFTGLANQCRQIVAVVHVVNEEVVFRAIVGRAHFNVAEQSASGFGWLQVKAVVADKAENEAVAVDAVVAEHLPHCDFACGSALVGNVLHKVGIACHGYPTIFSPTMESISVLRKNTRQNVAGS